MTELFQKDRTIIGRHINNINKEQELERETTCANFAHTKNYGHRENCGEESSHAALPRDEKPFIQRWQQTALPTQENDFLYLTFLSPLISIFAIYLNK